LQRHFPVARLLPRRSFSIHDIRSLLRPARPERFAAKFSVRFISIIQFLFSFTLSPSTVIQSFLYHSLIYTMGAESHKVTGAPTFPALALCAVSFSVSEVADPSTLSKSQFAAIHWASRLLASWNLVRKSSKISRYIFLYLPRGLVVMHLGGNDWITSFINIHSTVTWRCLFVLLPVVPHFP
jgi:hypothetical protein